jgi:hypothetical protein
MDQGLRPRGPSRLGDVARPVDMDAMHFAPEHAAQIDDRARALSRAADAVGIGDVGFDEAELADLAKRLDEEGLARITPGDAHPSAALEQELADVAADESTAAEDGDELP